MTFISKDVTLLSVILTVRLLGDCVTVAFVNKAKVTLVLVILEGVETAPVGVGVVVEVLGSVFPFFLRRRGTENIFLYDGLILQVRR